MDTAQWLLQMPYNAAEGVKLSVALPLRDEASRLSRAIIDLVNDMHSAFLTAGLPVAPTVPSASAQATQPQCSRVHTSHACMAHAHVCS